MTKPGNPLCLRPASDFCWICGSNLYIGLPSPRGGKVTRRCPVCTPDPYVAKPGPRAEPEGGTA